MKIAGVLLILSGSIWIAAADIRERRRVSALLQELSAALLEMEAAIRWKRQVLPRAIAQQTERPQCGTYFASVLDAMEQGLSLQDAWERTFSPLQPRAAADYLCRVELNGDETHLMGNLHMASESLQQMQRDMCEKQRQEEKLHLSLLFSGSGMLIIFLL